MNITNNERVEQYILNRMSETEKSAFQFELMQNRNLQEEVKSVRRLQKTLLASNPNRTNTNTDKASFDMRWLLPLLSLPILYFVLNSSPTSEMTSPPVNNNEIAVPIIEEGAKSEENTIKSEIENRIQEEKSIPKTERKEQPQKIKEKKKAPIYAANYDVNPLIEDELSSFLRGDYEVTKITPETELVYQAKDGRISFSYHSELETEKTPEDDFSLVMEIYSNEVEAFEKAKFIIQSPVNLNADTSPYQLTWAATFDAKPSLYYYLLKDDYSGVILNGGKFKVK